MDDILTINHDRDADRLRVAWEADQLFVNWSAMLSPELTWAFCAKCRPRGITTSELEHFIEFVNGSSPMGHFTGNPPFYVHNFSIGAEEGGGRVVYIHYSKCLFGTDWDEVGRVVVEGAHSFGASEAAIKYNGEGGMVIRVYWPNSMPGNRVGERKEDG